MARQPQTFQLAVIDNEEQETFLPSDQILEFLHCVAQGFPTKHACSMAGISNASMLTWLNPNHQRHKPGLLKLFERAQAMAFGMHIRALNESKDPKAHMFVLEHTEKQFVPFKNSPNVINNIGVQAHEQFTLSPETLQTLSKAYDDMREERSGAPRTAQDAS